MSVLKDRLGAKIEEHRPRTRKLLTEHSDEVVGQVTVRQIIGGIRGVKSLVTDISYLDPQTGIRYRGLPLPEAMEQLPKPPGKEQPYVEGLIYFLLTGDMPGQEETQAIVGELQRRRQVPQYVFDTLRALPTDSHPMTMFSTAILSMQRESHFARAYQSGDVQKEQLWEPMYEDMLDIIARLPAIAAYIYRMKYRSDTIIPSRSDLDHGANFAHMMGIGSPYDEVARMHMVIHADHESGNASAHTTHLVASTLSDGFYALSAGLNALAGPLHGLAAQEVLRWIQGLMDAHEEEVPSKEQVREYCWETLNSGQVIPGYGHPVLRQTDPRYMVQRRFCQQHLKDDPLFQLVSNLYDVVPDILREHGKAKNPWPNVDAQSGVIHWHYGLTEYEFYTVLFGLGRAIGVLSNVVWDRALLYPIERPKSVTTAMLEEMVAGS